MPHHSKHQRPPVSGAFPRQSSSGSSASQSPHYFRRSAMPPPGISSSMSMPPGSKGVTGAPQSPLHHHTLGLHHNHGWMSLPPYSSSYQKSLQQQQSQSTMQQQPHQQQGIYRMPITPLKEEDASKASRVSHSLSTSSYSREGSPPTILKKHERSKSFESHEIAASVLLLASSIRENDRQGTGKSKEEGDESDDNGSTEYAESSRPLKKRKKVTEINLNEHTFHVSPMSGKSSPADPGPETSTSNTPSSSYDTREHENILVKPSPILPTFKSGIEDFPLQLHSALSDVEFENNVMKWLPDGKAWKIIRWDALRRHVMPKYFPTIDSIDTFLMHLQSWGFHETSDGPDAGAYSHMFFRRGHPDLCSEMSPKVSLHESIDADQPDGSKALAKETGHYASDNRSDKSDNSRSILRVPSLASTAGSTDTFRVTNHGVGDSDHMGSGNKRDYSSVVPSRRSPMGPYVPWGGMSSVRSGSGPVFVNYRPEEMTSVDAHNQHMNWKYSFPTEAKPPTWMRAVPGDGSSGSSFHHPQQLYPTEKPPSPTTATGSSVTMRGMPPYSPIRIRSGRGAHRIAISAGRRSPVASQTESTAPSSFSSAPPARAYPISNRGGGRRVISAPPSISRISSDELQMFKAKANETNDEPQGKEIKAPSPANSCDQEEGAELKDGYSTGNVPILAVPSVEEIKSEKV